MFKCFFLEQKKLVFFVKKNNLVFNKILKKKIWFFMINLTGRIFRWLRFATYIKLLLPDSNKPYLFFGNSYFVISEKDKPEFIILPFFYKESRILSLLTKIRKQNIFNQRGFIIKNRIFFKKRGKVTSYVTNK